VKPGIRFGVCLLVGVLCLTPGGAWALSVGGNSPLQTGTVLFDPDRFTEPMLPVLQMLYPGQTVGFYNRPDIDLAASQEWALVDTLESAFDQHVRGILRSQVWEHEDGHKLFLYQLQNLGDVGISGTKFTVHTTPALNILDAGVLGDGIDIQDMSRMAAGALDEMFFEIAWSEPLELQQGQQTSWIYVETDAHTHHLAYTTVRNHTASADNVPLLVPMPEPMTMSAVGLAVLGLGGYIAKRRRLA